MNGLRALGLAAVLGVPGLRDRARAGVTAVIDGIDGCVIIDPSAEQIREYEARRDAVARTAESGAPAAASRDHPRRGRDQPRSQS